MSSDHQIVVDSKVNGMVARFRYYMCQSQGQYPPATAPSFSLHLPYIYDVRKFLGILDPPSPLFAFHSTYQYCSSAKSANFLTPLPPSVRTSQMDGPLARGARTRAHGTGGEAGSSLSLLTNP